MRYYVLIVFLLILSSCALVKRNVREGNTDSGYFKSKQGIAAFKCIRGHLNESSKEQIRNFAGNMILLKSSTGLSAITGVKENHDFELQFPVGDNAVIDVYIFSIAIDTLFLATFSNPTTDTIHLSLTAPITVEKDFGGRIVCPKCNKAANTMNVVYGMGQHTISDAYYTGTCAYKYARYYCKRDNIKY